MTNKMRRISMHTNVEKVSEDLVAEHGSAVEALRVFHSGGKLVFSDTIVAQSMLLALYGIAILELADTSKDTRNAP